MQFFAYLPLPRSLAFTPRCSPPCFYFSRFCRFLQAVSRKMEVYTQPVAIAGVSCYNLNNRIIVQKEQKYGRYHISGFKPIGSHAPGVGKQGIWLPHLYSKRGDSAPSPVEGRYRKSPHRHRQDLCFRHSHD